MNGAGNGHPRERLSEYLDDRLAVEERAAMDRHLAECEDCRVELDALRRLARAIADDQVPPVPVDLAARIGRKLDAATGVQPHRRRFVVPATIAATIAALGILVTLQWREGRLEMPRESGLEEKIGTVQDLPRLSAPPAPVELELAPPARAETEPEGRKRADGDAKKKEAPAIDGRFHQETKDEGSTGGVVSGVVGGVVGGVVDGVEGGVGAEAASGSAAPTQAAPPAAPLAKTSAVSPCLDRWSDSGVRGIWAVPDIHAAVTDLGRIARDVGGIGLWRGIDDGRPYVIVVPRDRYEEVFYALRARGVGSLEAPPALAPGTDCTGISVALTAVATTPAEGPR